jgi:hypothetical protein
MQDVLTIGADGAAQFTRRGQVEGALTLTPDQLAQLVAQFDAANFAQLQERYDNGNVADDIYQAITFSRDGQTRTVTVAQAGGAGITPQPLLDLIGALNEISDTVRAGGSASPAATATTSGLPEVNEGADRVIYQVKGGIAGLDTALYIDRHGGLHLQERGVATRSGQLTGDQLTALLALFDQGDFFALQDRYAPLAAVSDNMIISITYNTGAAVKRVQAESGATPPAQFTAIADYLAAIQADLMKK